MSFIKNVIGELEAEIQTNIKQRNKIMLSLRHSINEGVMMKLWEEHNKLYHRSLELRSIKNRIGELCKRFKNNEPCLKN